MAIDIKNIDFKAGDIFLSFNPWFIGRLIIAFERFWSRDGKATYGHGGIITSNDGEIFEAATTLKKGHIDSYANGKLLIVRPVSRTDGTFIPDNVKVSVAKLLVDRYEGDIYPGWRLILHMIPPLARYFSSGKFMVCTELVARYLWMLGARHNQWPGTNPDNLADEVRLQKGYEIIFEGDGSDIL